MQRTLLALAALLLAVPVALLACNGAGYGNWDDDTAAGDDDDGADPDIDTNSPITIASSPVGATKTAGLILRNDGEGTLDVYGIDVVDSAGHVVWADTWAGSVAPGEETVLEDQVEATCIDPGQLLGVLEVDSNDPNKPSIPVDIHVDCVAPN